MNALPLLSLCMIARDSARTLGACLQSVRPWVDEIIVVDTGSHDETPSIARQFGARVFDFPWCDDFSAARNESLRPAHGEWLFWMDSDDTIDESNGRRLRDLAYSPHAAAVLGYVMQVHCPGPCAFGETDCTVVDHVKLFRNLPELKFAFRIHEQVLPAIRELGGEVAWTDIHVVHSGSDQSLAGRKKKQERDMRILHLELVDRPEHPFTLFNLGMTCADIGDHQSAIGHLKRSIAVANATESHLRKAYALLVNSLMQLGRQQEASEVCESGLEQFPSDPELLFRTALIAQHSGQLEKAEAVYILLLSLHRDRHFSSIDPGILGYKARQNLAATYGAMGRYDLAELQWRNVVREMPEYRVAWQGLVDSQFNLGRTQSALLEVNHMLGAESLRITGLLSRARWAVAKGEFTTAKKDILTANQDYPAETEPLEALCRLLFEHGEPFEAKLALGELAQRMPNDAAVLHNLGTVNAYLGHSAEAAAAYQESLRLRPESVQTQRELANVLRSQNEVARTSQQLQPDRHPATDN